MRTKPRTLAALAVAGAALLVIGGALDKAFLHLTGTVVRREVPRR